MENSMNDMQRVLDAQKKHFIDEGSPSIELRVDRLNRLKSLIIDNRYDFVDALNEDYGNRSKNTSIMTDPISSRINVIIFGEIVAARSSITS